MSENDPNPGTPGSPDPAPKDRDAWKLVYFGQISRDLVPYHPEPPEAPEDELTRAALTDPDSATQGETPAHPAPTFWRVLAVLALVVVALAVVFWRTR